MARDLRKYARQTGVRLVVGALLLLFLVGDGLIYLIYGREAAIMGLLCLLAGLTPVAAVALVLALVNAVAKRANRD